MRNGIIAIALFFMHSYAFANQQQSLEVEAALQEWVYALESKQLTKVVEFYDEDSTLLATLAPEPITTEEQRIDYFLALVKKANLSVEINSQNIRSLSKNKASVTGLYTFHYEEDNNLVEIPARYSFIFEKTNGEWTILEHHSSGVP